MRVGIVDDRQIDLDKLKFILQEEKDIELIFATTDSEEAYREIQKNKIELLIADIEMPGISGYELADIIQTHGLLISVIFVTAKSGYAVQAFELNVHDYILKPYTKERLQQSLDRFREKQHAGNLTGRLVLKQKSRIEMIPKKDIIFAERTGRSTTIYTVDDEHATYLSMNELEASLRENNFIRSHRSFLINLHFVKSFSIYTKKSYSVTFDGTKKIAMLTKDKMDYLQKYYF
ncbi:LytR/AlgR family response regulator transcription factor [Lederbergia galactosidilytica]|uniref:LuxR family transcriptional regulator n=1 Tax=Lederbergia galactosidilytica TaxID=217031 RepID=A0A0Q9XWE5_9BACI|nr:LytTR family DNA-binding domain-containing protein [Lederbergia galactosidilytica]KRG12293.1 LuxR family transcriptional regulator [Virgibacillus soli]KRG13083.1 LuxR family transcriptional regulator [Lederbergia galactosidilytica]MBP1913899.1 DNA-binding LytR/AlgR family response regulator [Lederbergia galactosidilytica]OAK73943.1 LuxR family transcriptional regulator [Lederbergia galactosidilytica]